MRHIVNLGFGKVRPCVLAAFAVLISQSATLALPHHPMLDHFQDVFVQSGYGGLNLPSDRHGNDMSGHTVFLPTPGDGTGAPASVSVTLDSDEPFFLPLFQLLGTSYSDGTPDDTMENINVFKTLEITFKVDGKVVINKDNVLDYYSSFFFNSRVKIDSPPINGIIWLQGIGYIAQPLSAGRHTLSLHVKNTKPVFGTAIYEYNNTWNLTVMKPRRS